MKTVVADVNKNSVDKIKLPDFGYLVLNKQTGQFVRIGHTQYLELHKLPVKNCIPTRLAAFGIDPEPHELEAGIKALAEAGYDEKQIIKQVIYIKKLLGVTFNVRRSTLRSYPFCRIALLTPDQLQFMNESLKIQTEYEAYKRFLIAILRPEFLIEAFKQEGVGYVPEINLDDTETTAIASEDENDIAQLIKTLLQKDNGNKSKQQ